LQREARSKFRIRRPSRLIVVLFALPLATLLYLYGKLSLAALNDDYAREPLVIAIGIIYLMVTILMTAIMGSGALARERETGTWEGLLLSLLPVRSIIAAKVLAPVLACFSYSIIFWPLLALCITRWRFAGSRHNDVSLTQVLAGFLVILSTAWLCTAWGMLCSWYAKRSATATGWAVGSMLMAWIFFPVFLIWSFTSNSRGSGEAMLEIMRYWHPFIALVPIAEPTNFPSYRVERLSVLWDGFTSSAAFFFLGCLMLRVVYHGIRHESGLDRTPEQSP
jgi:ABC-type transport system involved in multi-copper enzyme maturation permease subunit